MKIAKIITILIICTVLNTYAQLKEGKFYLSPPVQPSSAVHFKLAYSYDYSIYVGQPFTFKATNVSNKRLRVKFDLIALTICGNEVKAPFDIVLDVKESIGFGNAFFDNDYIASVTKTNCADSKPVEYTFKGKKLTGKNKINDVYIKNLVVNPLPDKLATKANAEPKKELTDDEKLNQAMMKQLEEKFDEEQKTKKIESLAVKKEESSYSNYSNISSANTIKLTTPYFEKKGKMIVFYKDSVLKSKKSSYISYAEYGKLAEDFDFYIGSVKVTAKKNSIISFFYGYLDNSISYDRSNIGNISMFVNKNSFKCTACRCGDTFFGEPSESAFIFKTDGSFAIQYDCETPKLMGWNIINKFNKRWPN